MLQLAADGKAQPADEALQATLNDAVSARRELVALQRKYEQQTGLIKKLKDELKQVSFVGWVAEVPRDSHTPGSQGHTWT